MRSPADEPVQSWLLFTPMMPNDMTFGEGPPEWTSEADDWLHVDDGTTTTLVTSYSLANVDLWVGFDVRAVNATSFSTPASTDMTPTFPLGNLDLHVAARPFATSRSCRARRATSFRLRRQLP